MSVQTPILHHYAASPFSEKVRKILAFKKLPWHSVEISPVMPRPDLMPLTGGYRKTPVLQLGCDVYCDTKLIARVIDRLQPDLALIPPGLEAYTMIAERWVDQALFFNAVALFVQPVGLAAFGAAAPPGLLDTFMKDRAALFAQGGSQPLPCIETSRAELPGMLGALEAQLGNQPFLHGDQPCLIDFAVYHPVWFVYGNAGIAAELQPFPKLRAWVERILALGAGSFTPMTGSDAIKQCRDATAAQPPLAGADLQLPSVRIGDGVEVAAKDYAIDVVIGELVIANAAEIAIRRRDERAGTVIVHFPPEGFSVKPR